MTEYATEQQRKWFASVRAGIERDTGKSLDQWVEIARACPETKPRARVNWLKAEHGLGVNRASVVLEAAFPETGLGWDRPEDLRAALWLDPGSEAILQAVERIVGALPGVLTTQRKGYTAFSHRAQFAALKPVRGGGALLGLRATPDGGWLAPRGSQSWSERLTASVRLASAAQVDAELQAEVVRAYEAG